MEDRTTEPTKVCTKCGETKSVDAFYKDKRARDGLYSSCRACSDARHRAYYEENFERVREYHKKWYKENFEKAREYKRKRYEENPEPTRERTRNWGKQNPDKAREGYRRRRARKAQAEGTHTVADMRRQYKVQKGLCWWCLQPVKWEDRHDDHLIPLSKNGTNWPNNMVVSCAHCNCSKSAMMPDEFSGRLF